jgi:hypothetical protein
MVKHQLGSIERASYVFGRPRNDPILSTRHVHPHARPGAIDATRGFRGHSRQHLVHR